MIRAVPKDQPSKSRQLQSILANEAVNFKLKSTDSDEKTTDSDDGVLVLHPSSDVAPTTSTELSFSSQYYSSQWEISECENATDNVDRPNTPCALNDDSTDIGSAELGYLSFEEEDQYESASEDIEVLEDRRSQECCPPVVTALQSQLEYPEHLETIEYPVQQWTNAEQDEPPDDVIPQRNTFVAELEESVPVKYQPNSTLRRSNSPRVPDHTESSRFSSLRKTIGFSPSRHTAAFRRPYDNYVSEDDDNLVHTPSNKESQGHLGLLGERSDMSTQVNKTVKSSQLQRNKRVSNPFDRYSIAEEKGNMNLQQPKPVQAPFDLGIDEYVRNSTRPDFAVPHNRAYESDDEISFSSQPRPTQDTTYRCRPWFKETSSRLADAEPVIQYPHTAQPEVAASPQSSFNSYTTQRTHGITQSKPTNEHPPYQPITTTPINAFDAGMATQTRGLQRTMSMWDSQKSRVPDRSNSRMAVDSTVCHSLAFSNKPKLSAKPMLKKNTAKKSTRRICLDSDAQISSRKSPYLDWGVIQAGSAYSQQPRPSQEAVMQVPQNSIGVRKFGEDTFFTSVPKVWAVSDCIAHVRNKLGRSYSYGDLDLWIKNRCIMLDKRNSLSDYPGLTTLHVVRRPSSRNAHPSYQTSRADDSDPYCDDTCVGMSCGHAISPDNLYQYSWKKIQNGGTEVTCPAVPDANKPGEQCSKTWDFQSISELACLSDDENYLFCDKLFSNVLEKEANIYICPVCKEAIFSSCTSVFNCFYCEKSGKSFSFCVKCNRAAYDNMCYNSECQESLPKVRALLKDCRMRTLVGVSNCPSVRACPVCNYVIEYDEEDSCKHMTCPRNTCQTKFCFICLKVKTDKYYWPCGGAYEQCQPTPRQII